MTATKNLTLINIIDEKLLSKVIIVILMFSVVILSGHLSTLPNTNKSTNPVNNLKTTINPNVRKQAENALNKFSGGFLEQPSNGNSAIYYFIQNPGLTVGFGNSIIKMLTIDNSNTNQPVLTPVSITFPNSNLVKPVALHPITSKSTYFIGSSIGSNKQEYSTILFKNLYNNIDLKYTIKNGALKYNFLVYPGGDPADIQLQWHGAVTVQQTSNGMKLIITTSSNSVSLFDNQPVSFQDIPSNTIHTTFKLTGTNRYGFSLSKYNTNSLLTIDPTIMTYSTFFGGNGLDQAFSMTVDKAGNIYVTGRTLSTDFPAYNDYLGGGGGYGYYYDTFVFKLSSDGSLVYSTHIGGSSNDEGLAIAVDAVGNAYVTGDTYSNDFPTTANVSQRTFGGGATDAFIFKLSANGELSYCTYLGGASYDYGFAIAVDNSGYAYVTGSTASTGLATLFVYQTIFKGGSDVFIAKFTPNGLKAMFTYYGGSGYEEGWGIVVNDYIYVTGETSGNLPLMYGNNTYGGGSYDTFVIKMFNTGYDILESTYLGGSGTDYAYGITVNANGNAFITGYTDSNNFPTSSNAYNSTYGGSNDVYVTELSPSLGSIVYSTYIGGPGDDRGSSIALDSNGNAYISGINYYGGFPMLDAYNSTFGGSGSSIFLFKLSSTGNLDYSTYVGSSDEVGGIVVDSNGVVDIAGYTYSNNYPVVNAYQKNNSTVPDIVVSKLITVPQTNLTPSQGMIYASINQQSLALFWNAPSYQDSLLHYDIYRGTSPDSYSYIGSSPDTIFVDDSVITGVTYHYVIYPIYSFGQGIKSNDFSGSLVNTTNSNNSNATSSSNNNPLGNLDYDLGGSLAFFVVLSGIVIFKRRRK